MNKGRILIVDDQKEILESLGAVLADEGHELLTAGDGQEALHIVQSDAPDIVFLDIWIPGIDGMQTLKAIKKIDPDCSVIMMSGHGTIETAVKAIKLGATDYLEKPLNLDDILHLVEKSISERTVKSKQEKNYRVAESLLGVSRHAANLRKSLERASADHANVSMIGDQGVGKEFLARILHRLDGKDRAALLKIRCIDLNETNMEAAIDKLDSKNIGKSKRQSSGSLLLIRIDRLEKKLRNGLFELLKDYTSKRHGGGSFRIISTSTVDLNDLVKQDDFPKEFADFLGRRVVRAPALKDRPEDIALLAEYFIKEAADEFDKTINEIDPEVIGRLKEYSWPGNIKELKIVIEHMVMNLPDTRISVHDLMMPLGQETEEQAAGAPKITVKTIETSFSSANYGSDRRPGPGAARFQKSLRGKVVMYGQGLHSGGKTGLTLSPLPCSAGILFGHITADGTVTAVLDNVDSTGYSTSLKRNGLVARTIEHLMAVFHVYGLTNVLAKISTEVPIMDGSALEFCNLIESAEIIVQDESVDEIRIVEPIELPIDDDTTKSMRIEPSDCLEIEYFMDYPKPIGKLNFAFKLDNPESFKTQIAPARTFGFVRDMRMMDEMGLAGGGRLSNVILMDDEKVINPPLRFPDEFVRHKILDIIGDFYLLGRPFVGKIIARQTGHTENIAMLKLIRDKLGL